MDDTTIDYVLQDNQVDQVSGIPLSAVVFMLYYGLELKHFLLEISDEFIQRFPLQQYHVGEFSSMYLSGSAAQGLYLNTMYLPDARDIDIVTINKKYPVRESCKYEKFPLEEWVFGSNLHENNDNQNICQRAPELNVTTTECDDRYLNIKVLPDTPKGYALLQKCRRYPLPVQTMDDLYVSSRKTTEARVQFWHELKPFLRQRFQDLQKDSSLFSLIEPHGPAATAFMSLFESTTPFEIDIVFCIPYPMNTWPADANEWITRERPSGWPPQTLIDEIVQDGCTLIPKGSPGSPMEDFEWRISFTGDLKLARNLTRVQRELMHIIKALISEPQHKFEVIDLTSSIESYQFLNLLYYESEHINQQHWQPEHIARMLFRLLDGYLEHFHRTELSHYFIQSRNIFEKFLSFSEEEIDTVLYTVLRVRQDPLGQLLQQEKYLRLRPLTHKMVYLPFVEKVSSSGHVPDKLYVNTLVRLAKAHLLEGHHSTASIYANDAVRFYHKMRKDTLADTEYMDLMFVVALSYHRTGLWDKTLEYLEKLYLVMNKHRHELLVELFGETTYVQLLMLYARTLIMSLEHVTKSNSHEEVIASAKQFYYQARTTDSSNFPLVLDMMSAYLYLGDTESFESLLQDIPTSFPEYESFIFKPEDYAVGSEATPMSNVEVIYDRRAMVTAKRGSEETVSDLLEGGSSKTYLETFKDNTPNEAKDDETGFDETEVGQTSFETPLGETPCGQTSFETSFFETPFEQEGSGDSLHEIVVDTSSFMHTDHLQTCSEQSDFQDLESVEITPFELHDSGDSSEPLTEQVPLIPDSEKSNVEVLYDRNKHMLFEQEDIPFTQADLNMIDVGVFTDYCRLKAFQNLNIDEKVKSVSKRLKRKLQDARMKGQVVSLRMLEAAYEMFYPKTPKLDPTAYFHDILSNEMEYVVYSTSDIPMLDEVLVNSFSRAETNVVKIPANIYFLHIQIRYYKTVGNVAAVGEIISNMETLAGDIDDGNDASFSKYLTACHLNWTGDNEAARNMFIDSRMYQSALSVKAQVLEWYSQVFDIVRQFEPKNKYLNDIFTV